MFREQDPHSYAQFLPLYEFQGNPQSVTQIGFISLDYQVSLYNDVQVLTAGSVTQPQNQQFIVNCTQRIMLTNTPDRPWRPRGAPDVFLNYPILFTASIEITQPQAGLTLELLDYSPHTVNTAVEQNTSSGSTTTTSSTIGTSLAQSSTYGASAGLSGGFTGDLSASVTNTRTRERSTTNAADSSHNASAAMSIKDWDRTRR
jgi:hypothetical protein